VSVSTYVGDSHVITIHQYLALYVYSQVAQLAERLTVNQLVVGSNPTLGAMNKLINKIFKTLADCIYCGSETHNSYCCPIKNKD
jgi:hypothetical protein